MSLMEAACLMERLQGRAAHAGEVEALRIARDALLTLIGDGFSTLSDCLAAKAARPAARAAHLAVRAGNGRR